MTAYSASSEEALRAQDLLKDWFGEGFLTEAQYQRMQQETVSELRRTNLFLRLVLFLFTLIIVCSAVALFFVIFLSRPSTQTTGIFLLIFAVMSYAATELAIRRARLYRHGIEEALAACSVAFLCAGMYMALFSGHPYSLTPDGLRFLVPAAGAIVSLWIWRRFGLAYAFVAAMIFVLWMTDYWTSSSSTHHLIVAAFYAAGLITVSSVRSHYRFGYLNERYQIVEVFLWLGIYLAVNLQLSTLNLFPDWWRGPRSSSEFSRIFYWATWVLIWCLPPAILLRGLRRKDRLVIAVGVVVAILTLATNKAYLGWQRHTWDLMLLGALLIGVALLVRRWLAAGQGGIRQGFTAQRLSGKDERYRSAASVAFGLVTPQSTTIKPQNDSPNVRFGGGDSGGGGASSDF